MCFLQLNGRRGLKQAHALQCLQRRGAAEFWVLLRICSTLFVFILLL